ncbi:MAG: GxxExxY protein [Rhodanobacteraceae bacterium]
MNTDTTLAEADLTERVSGTFYAVYNELGHGFLESVYENSLALALRGTGVAVVQQAPLRVDFREHTVGEFRADLLVDDRLIVEVKAVSRLAPAHEVQLVNYLKVTGIRVGLLMNFGPHPQFKRRIFGATAFHPL